MGWSGKRRAPLPLLSFPHILATVAVGYPRLCGHKHFVFARCQRPLLALWERRGEGGGEGISGTFRTFALTPDPSPGGRGEPRRSAKRRWERLADGQRFVSQSGCVTARRVERSRSPPEQPPPTRRGLLRPVGGCNNISRKIFRIGSYGNSEAPTGNVGAGEGWRIGRWGIRLRRRREPRPLG